VGGGSFLYIVFSRSSPAGRRVRRRLPHPERALPAGGRRAPPDAPYGLVTSTSSIHTPSSAESVKLIATPTLVEPEFRTKL
jgi:hypothetical protein